MQRTELVAKLERIAPALSSNDLVPILTHFCFTGTHVFAFNEQIGISAPCKTEFEGAVPGATLLSLLKATGSKDVIFEPKKDELAIKASSSRFKLGLLPPDRFVWEVPKLAKEGMDLDYKKFRAAIDCCMRSVSIDTSVPDMLGVTLIADEREISLFATNYSTMSYARVPIKKPTKGWDRVILSGVFCKELLTLSAEAKALHLEIHKDYALMSGAGGTILFGKLVESAKPLNFHGNFEDSFPAAAVKKLVPIPTKLEGILERACIISADNGEPVKMEIVVEKENAEFYTSSRTSEARDTMQLLAQEPVTIAVNPKLVKIGYGAFEKMLITKEVFIMATKDTAYLVGAE